VSLDIDSGVELWRAEILPMAAVSKQLGWKDVSLERRGARLVMRGYQSDGCYLQTYELASGRLLSSVAQKRN
jgi:hypothetical protein